MHIGVPAETRPGEARVAATPETVKKLVAQGHRVTVQQGAGAGAYFTDEAYGAAGAELVTAEVALGAQIVLKVHAPSPAELPSCKADSVVIGMLNPFDQENIGRMAQAGLIAFSLEAAPRTTRAQSLDVLSSQ